VPRYHNAVRAAERGGSQPWNTLPSIWEQRNRRCACGAKAGKSSRSGGSPRDRRRYGAIWKDGPRGRVIVETGAEALGLAEIARQRGHEVRVVPSMLAPSLGVGQRRLKSDQRDARVLSESSCRMDLPSVHIPAVETRRLQSRLWKAARKPLSHVGFGSPTEPGNLPVEDKRTPPGRSMVGFMKRGREGPVIAHVSVCRQTVVGGATIDGQSSCRQWRRENRAVPRSPPLWCVRRTANSTRIHGCSMTRTPLSWSVIPEANTRW
jgi:hypothetical protein